MTIAITLHDTHHAVAQRRSCANCGHQFISGAEVSRRISTEDEIAQLATGKTNLQFTPGGFVLIHKECPKELASGTYV